VALHSTRLLLIVNRYTPSTGLKRDEVETAFRPDSAGFDQ
jgi:hypothetical protein